jgi:hypothetical protein
LMHILLTCKTCEERYVPWKINYPYSLIGHLANVDVMTIPDEMKEMCPGCYCKLQAATGQNVPRILPDVALFRMEIGY